MPARHKVARAGLIDLDRSADDDMGPRRLVLGRNRHLLTPAYFAECNHRGAELVETLNIDRWVQSANPRPGATFYDLVLGFYPTVPPIAQTGDVGAASDREA